MAGLAYRSGGDDEPLHEARIEALLPGTRARLREACERGEALASEQPRWVGRRGRWLLAAGAVALGLLGPLFPSFGRIDDHPFAHGLPEQALLFVACVAELVLGALAVRSLALHRGGLPPGLYLFASALVEIRGGRVRTWPLERLRRMAQRGSEVRLDLGPSGWLRLTTGEEDLADTLWRTRARLTQAIDDHDETALDQLDPCHHERGRGSFAPLTRPAHLPTWPLRRPALAALVALAALLGGHVAAQQARRLSDWLGIDLARKQGDATSLHSYLWQGGPLADEADEAWLSLLGGATDEALLNYMAAPYTRRSAQADDILVERVLRRNEPDHVRVLDSPADRRNELRKGDLADAPGTRRTVSEATDDLRHYLAVGRPGQPRRAQVERRVFELVLARDREVSCWSDDEPLAPYLDLTDERGERARAARWSRRLDDATICPSLTRLESARALARTDEQRAAVAAAWKAHFEKLRADAQRPPYGISFMCADPDILSLTNEFSAQVSELWAYLGDHPETELRVLASPGQAGITAPRKSPHPSGEREDWAPMLDIDVIHTLTHSRDRACLSQMLGARTRFDMRAAATPAKGPRLALGVSQPGHQVIIEMTLSLPGSAVRRARVTLSPADP